MIKCPNNPNYNKFVIPDGYQNLGWQISSNNETYKKCREQSHKTKEFDNSMFLWRCTDVITVCDECKYIFHTDMSD